MDCLLITLNLCILSSLFFFSLYYCEVLFAGSSAQPGSFYFNALPFAEDVREFQFTSFSNFPASWQPNEQQQEAADNLVMMLDLTTSGKKEYLQPDFTPNPVLEVNFVFTGYV